MEKIRNSNKLIFTRYNMYKMLMLDYPKYMGNDDWYSLERYLSIIYNCDCTDCGGHDISRKCNVENVFFQKYGVIRNVNLL